MAVRSILHPGYSGPLRELRNLRVFNTYPGKNGIRPNALCERDGNAKTASPSPEDRHWKTEIPATLRLKLDEITLLDVDSGEPAGIHGS